MVDKLFFDIFYYFLETVFIILVFIVGVRFSLGEGYVFEVLYFFFGEMVVIDICLSYCYLFIVLCFGFFSGV